MKRFFALACLAFVSLFATAQTVRIDSPAPTSVTGFWNGYGTYAGAPVQYYKDAEGRVHLSGLVYRPAVSWPGPYNEAIFEMPVCFRPEFDERFVIIDWRGNAGYLAVNRNDGWVSVNQVVDPTGWVSLSGISYRARKDPGC